MPAFIARRLLQLIPILFGLSLLLFVWVRALPGGPATALLGERATPEKIAEVRHVYGLDRSLPVQYWSYLKRTATLDFGTSIVFRRPVTDEMRRRFPATIELTASAMLFSVGIGVPLGFAAARRHQRAFDHLSMAGSLIGVSVPVFALAYLLKYVFAVKLGWLPTTGRIKPGVGLKTHTNFYLLDTLINGQFDLFWDVVKHLILPAVALGSIPLAIIARITRAAVLDVSNEDYVRTARAKGMGPSVVNRRHILRNALLPIVTIIGLQVGLLLSGAVLTERVFSWPGMGQLVSESLQNSDYPVIQGAVLFLAIVFVMVNLLVDLLYAVIDPRIRVS